MTEQTITERDQAYADIFTTALEGGIGYWSECSAYRWTLPDLTREQKRTMSVAEQSDVLGFEATIEVKDDLRDDDMAPEYVINRATIAKGVGLFVKMDWSSGSYFGRAKADLRDAHWDDLDIDADIADTIVQLALFGKAVFG